MLGLSFLISSVWEYWGKKARKRSKGGFCERMENRMYRYSYLSALPRRRDFSINLSIYLIVDAASSLIGYNIDTKGPGKCGAAFREILQLSRDKRTREARKKKGLLLSSPSVFRYTH